MTTAATAPPGTHAGRRPVALDAVTLLTVYVLLLLLVPSDRYLPGIGASGSPAVLWGLAAALWWVWHRIRRVRSDAIEIERPLRALAFVLFGTVAISYFVAMTRAIAPVEIGPADNGVLRLISYSGILLVASEGIPDLDRMLVLLRRLVGTGGVVAAIGLIEFVTRTPIVSKIPIPGLTATTDYQGVITRGDFVRSASTATHPLEYTTLLAMLLPLAVTMAIFDRGGRRIFPWVWVALLGAALASSGSRSAVIGLALGLVPLIPTWSATIRWRALALALVGVAGLAVALPGLIQGVVRLFVDASSDSSALSRSNSFGVFFQQFGISPIVGRGFGTFLPMYRIFDNQYLGLLLEIGILGTAAFLAVLLVPAVLAVVASRRAPTMPPVMRKLGPAMAAALVVGAAESAFFDALSFPKAAGMLFLTAGLAGGYVYATRFGRDPLTLAPVRLERTRR